MSKLLYLVGVDGSEWSERAAERAIHLAKDTGAKVKLLYVISLHEYQPMMVAGIEPPLFDEKVVEKNANKSVLQPLVNKYHDLGVEISTEFVWGEPVEVLHQSVKNHHANMLFVGRRGRSRLADLILGSVANKLAHYTGVPLVLVP